MNGSDRDGARKTDHIDDRQLSLVNVTTSSTSFVMRNIRRLAVWVTSRMGSFSSAPKIPNEDKADSELMCSASTTWDEMLFRCRSELEDWPPKISRRFLRCPLTSPPTSLGEHIDTDVDGKSMTRDSSRVRVFQWNVLSEALGKVSGNDNFVACPEGALDWRLRRWRLLEEIVSVKPDILCLQEVDHFKFLEKTLGSLGFKGIFCPKPDSPCIYVIGNNGPDGCAIFWNDKEWELVRSHERTLEVWGCMSNQVAILTILKRRASTRGYSNDDVGKDPEEPSRQLAVATTHLKARQGTLLSTLRQEQGKDLLKWIHYNCPTDCPLVLSGDFNAEPSEPVYKSVTIDPVLCLDSSYSFEDPAKFRDQDNGNIESKTISKSEPAYTTWKIRGEGEDCHTIDYMFYSRNYLLPKRVLALPSESEVGPGRVPSYQYPSDHFAMATDFLFLDTLTNDK